MSRFFSLSLSIGLALQAAAALAASEVKFEVELSPVGSFVARSPAVEGSAQKQGEKVFAKNVRLKLDDLSSGIELRDGHMKKRFLETATYPYATLKEATGEAGKFKGVLNVHGKDQPIMGTYTVTGGQVVAQFKTSSKGYDIKPANYMGVKAADEVNVTVTLPLSATTSAPAAPAKASKKAKR